MKKTLQLMTLTIGLFVYTNSQAVTICFDRYGYTFEVTATWTSHKYYVLSGEVNLGVPFTASGYFDLKTNDFYMLCTIVESDGCTSFRLNLQEIPGFPAGWNYILPNTAEVSIFPARGIFLQPILPAIALCMN